MLFKNDLKGVLNLYCTVRCVDVGIIAEGMTGRRGKHIIIVDNSAWKLNKVPSSRIFEPIPLRQSSQARVNALPRETTGVSSDACSTCT